MKPTLSILCRPALVRTLLPMAALMGMALGVQAQNQAARPYDIPKAAVLQFAKEFQDAVRRNEPQQVGRFVHFPLRVNNPAGGFRFVKADEFVGEYFRLFSPVLRAAVLKQDISNLEQSAGDVALGDGMLTVAGVCQDRRCESMIPKVTTVDLRAP